MDYWQDLTQRLTIGARKLPDELCRRQGAYLVARQNRDGGFGGREGPSDCYYTGFALRGLGLLGMLEQSTAERATGFLWTWIGRDLSSIDFLSLVMSAVLLEAEQGIDVFSKAGRSRRQIVLEVSERFRREDGGYAKSQGSLRGSTYHTFLHVICRQLAGVSLIDPARNVEFIRSRRRDDGGFVEVDRADHGGTNPTSAAVALLLMLGAMDQPTRQGVVDFLAKMQNEEGGLRASARVPLADLLSTFTGVTALADLRRPDAIRPEAALQYVQALEQAGGGFRGGAWDDASDVEYTFYGLGALALLGTVQA